MITIRRLADSLRLRTVAGAIVLAIPTLLVVTAGIALILVLLGKNPAEALTRFVSGALGSDSARADVLTTAVPTLLCASGLLATFTAGLWNIGVEGQITMGAIFATVIALGVTDKQPNAAILIVEVGAAALGGMLWALLTAFLKVRAGVNEIFGGVALNFIAQNILIYLVGGPWQARGNSPTTVPFAAGALFPRFGDLRLSLSAVALAIAAYGIVFALLRGTRFGLQLRAMGRNEKSAALLGVRTLRNTVAAMVLCGALAGIAGAVQVLFVRGRLVPGISGGVGFLGVLIVLLVSVRAAWVPFVALFFAIVPIGSQRLAIAMDLDSSLGNVFQSALVFAALLANGLRARRNARRDAIK